MLIWAYRWLKQNVTNKVYSMAGHAQDHDFFIPGNNIWPPLSCLGIGVLAFGLLALLQPNLPLIYMTLLVLLIGGVSIASFFGGSLFMLSTATAGLFYFAGSFLTGNDFAGELSQPFQYVGISVLVLGGLTWLKGAFKSDNVKVALLGALVTALAFATVYTSGTDLHGLKTSPAIAKGLMSFGGALTFVALMRWFSKLIMESRTRGFKNVPLVLDLSNRYGIIFFIVSEIMFFAAFFAAFFFLRSYNPVWPPANIETLHIALPTINTLILLTSGVTVTWAHHALLHKDYENAKFALLLTVNLGVIFLFCQMYEYSHAAFTMSSGVYGSLFYMLTGFHGFHVLLGTGMLFAVLLRMYRGDFTDKHHFYFEASAWYWHFVDVVWIGLFMFVYLL